LVGGRDDFAVPSCFGGLVEMLRAAAGHDTVLDPNFFQDLIGMIAAPQNERRRAKTIVAAFQLMMAVG
jgi:hypothetical protein